MEFITEEDQEEEQNVTINNSMNSHVINSKNSKLQFLDKNLREEMKKKNEEKELQKLKEKEEKNKKKQRLFLKSKRLRSLRVKHPEKEKAKTKDEKQKKDKQNDKNDELTEIKNYYLGIKKKERKKEFRPKENSKDFFVFEWRESEDTAKNANPLYIPKNDASILFGRGNLGGIDPKEIKKQSKKYVKLIESYKPKSPKKSKKDFREI